jgi:murein DD-endopeptidase MepM/ murein hydrolase activator NlpD
MRNPDFAFGSRALGQVALVVLLAGMGAACSNSKRLSEPFFTGSTENQREIIGQGGSPAYQPMPAPVASNAVSRSNLAPPSQAYAMADPSTAGSTTGWSAVGGKVITVGASDTLDNLAIKYGVPPEQILTANQLSNSGQIVRGKVIVIPRRVALATDRIEVPATAYAAPAKPIAEAPMLASVGGATYVVQPGDTLYGIARKNGVSVASLISLNNLASPEAIRVGQTLRLDGSATAPRTQIASAGPGAPERPLGQLRMTSDGAAVAAPSQPMIRLQSPADSVANTDVALAAPKPPAMPSIPVESQGAPVNTVSATAAIDDAADAASADGRSFRWPVRGRIISGFGTKPNGERNDGINLAVPEGTSVKAVEAGTVIYAGNELEGYGNLILIRHADGFVSAYAHNKELLVKRGDVVRRGQTVAQAGMTGSVTSPQVHFELRKGAKPVNPLDYLAGA